MRKLAERFFGLHLVASLLLVASPLLAQDDTPFKIKPQGQEQNNQRAASAYELNLKKFASDTNVLVGALRWELTRTGQLRLRIRRDLGRSRLEWEAVNSEPFVTPERRGQWLLLATTFDGQTMRHYGNGRPIGAGASFTPPSLHLGTAELGNSPSRDVRQIVGSMDEFAVLSRALSADELRKLYEQGQP